jgi:Tfp pilus assembly major pilin PilA
MKAFLLACVAAVILAIIGGLALNSVQEPVDKAYTTTSVRLGA